MDENTFLKNCEQWYGDAARANAAKVIRKAKRLGYETTFHQTPKGRDIVAKFTMSQCPMLCIRAYNPDWTPAIRFTFYSKRVQNLWPRQNKLFEPIWTSLTSTRSGGTDEDLSLEDSSAVTKANKALDSFADIIASHPER